MDPEKLLKLCTRMILQQLFDQDDRLLELSWRVFEAGKADSVILDYLCEQFNGTTSQMYEILIQAVGEHVETYDLEERLLAQMLFTGSCDQIDSVFDLYMKRKRTRESMVKAYFTQKCIQYFPGRKGDRQSDLPVPEKCSGRGSWQGKDPYDLSAGSYPLLCRTGRDHGR